LRRFGGDPRVEEACPGFGRHHPGAGRSRRHAAVVVRHRTLGRHRGEPFAQFAEGRGVGRCDSGGGHLVGFQVWEAHRELAVERFHFSNFALRTGVPHSRAEFPGFARRQDIIWPETLMNQLAPQSILDPIKAHIDNFKRLAGWLLGLGSIPPVLELVCNIGPPWPHRRGVAYFAMVTLWVVILYTHGLWHQAPESWLKTRIKHFSILALAFLGAFVILLAFFVEDAPTPGNQIARGFFLKPEWKKVLEEGKFPDGEPFIAKSVHQLLAANEWKVSCLSRNWNFLSRALA